MADLPPFQSLFAMPIGDQRNIVVEVKGASDQRAFAYWSGCFWAKAPVSETPEPLGFVPTAQRSVAYPEGRTTGAGAAIDPSDRSALADIHFTEGLAAAAAVLRAQADAFRTPLFNALLGPDASAMLARVMDESAVAVTKAARP